MTQTSATPQTENTLNTRSDGSPATIHAALLDRFSDRLRYGFSTRERYIAGSEADENTLAENRRYWLERFGMNMDLERLAHPTPQVHGMNFIKTSEALTGEIDAILLDTPDLPALIYSADCTPVILYAPDIHRAALCHCGWKSTGARLAQRMSRELEKLGADLAKLHAVIGPALSIDGFEIDSPVLELLEFSTDDRQRDLWMKRSETKPDKFHADVPFINELQLRELGVRHVERFALSTDQHPQRFWSHRAGDWQRQGTFLQLF